MDSSNATLPYVICRLYSFRTFSNILAAYPVLLTAWHLIFATIVTQIMARFTTLLDGRKKQKMNGRIYMRAIVPIGAAFSLSLICGNLTYLYLSVSFIQMLKVSARHAGCTTSLANHITTGYYTRRCAHNWRNNGHRGRQR